MVPAAWAAVVKAVAWTAAVSAATVVVAEEEEEEVFRAVLAVEAAGEKAAARTAEA